MSAPDLAEYVARVYLRQAHPVACDATRKKHRVAVEALAKNLGRPPTLADLTNDNLAAFAAQKNLRNRLVAVREFAAQHPDSLREETPKQTTKPAKPQAAARKQQHLRREGIPLDLMEYLRDVYFPSKLPDAHEKTITHYRCAIRKLTAVVGHPATLDDLTDVNMAAVIRYCRAAGFQTISISKGILNRLAALWSFAARKRHVEEFPECGTIKNIARPIPNSWTLEQIQRLLAACKNVQGTICGIPAGSWWHALHVVAYATGERTGALLACPHEALNVERRTLSIPAEVRKGKKAAVYRQLPQYAMDALAEIIDPPRELLFPYPLVIARFYAGLKAILKAAGLPHGRRDKLQRMRRTFATFVEMNGGDATKALLHTDRRVTEQSYLDPVYTQGEPPSAILPTL